MVKILKENGIIKVRSPYNETFVKKASGIKGKWDGEYWCFDNKNEDVLKEFLIEIYGTDGETFYKTVRVELELDKYEGATSTTVKIGELVIAERLGRDKDVLLSKDTVIVSGGFASSGGSVKTPRLDTLENTILRTEIIEPLFEKIKDKAGVKVIEDKDDVEKIKKEIEKVELEIKRLEDYKKELLGKLEK